MNVRCSAHRPRFRKRHADRGFTLVELLLAVALSGVVVAVIVAALITALNVADTTTDAVRDSTDTGLISAYLYRDAASAGAIDPATAQRDPTLGVSTSDWSGCTQPGALVVRLSWADHHTSALTQSTFVATYALDLGLHQLTRRLCKNGTPTVDVVVGSSLSAAVATCDPGPACAAQPESVSLALTGSGAGASQIHMTASLRGSDTQAPNSNNSSPVALLALGRTPTPATCPNLTLNGTGAITVIGAAFIDGSCVGPTSPIQGTPALLQPTGVTSSIPGIVDPFRAQVAPSFTCGVGVNPSPIGTHPVPGAVVVYPQPVSITAPLAFEPGTYVFCAGLSIGAGARVTGSDVMFYVAGGTLTVDANAKLDLAAFTAGTDANLLIWVASAQTITLDGGPRVSSFRGFIYAPTSTIRLSSAVAANLGGLIAKDLTVLGPGRARIGLPMPVMAISPGSIPAGQVGVAYAPTTLTSLGGTSPSTWTATGLPTGVTINATTGQITGTPTVAGSFGVVVTTFDATAAAASIDYLLTVAPQLVITGPATLPAGQVGSSYTPTTITSSGGTPLAGGPPFYTWSATGLPAGLTINAATAVISGTPTAAGTFPVTVFVTDAMTTANRAYTITVKLAPTVTTTNPLPNGQVGSAYSTPMTASDGTPPYTWSATGLPAGLTINAVSGVISGTPTAAGAFSVNVTVTDAIGAVATRTYNLTILPPAVVLSVSGPATLPVGQQSSVYPTTTVTAVGGVPPYTWSATGLPAGLAINPATGAISGTPTAAGTFSVTVTVTDSAAASAPRAYTLTVVPPGCPTIPIVGWRGQYFSNRTLAGTSTLCRDDATINFDWGGGIPATGLPADDFSVRWTRTQDFAAGNYTFTMGSDDGSRLLIDNVLVFNNWVDQSYPPVPPTFTVPLTAGSHTIVMEFYERGGSARATLTWYSCAGPAAGWSAEYYSNNSLTGTPTLCRDDADVNFNWVAAAPAPVLPIDNFSVRWTRTQNFTAGNYMFALGSDAGARLLIDGTVVTPLVQWTPAHLYPATPPTIVVPLTAGNHTLVVEYYETTLNARVTFTSSSCSGAVGWNGEYFSNSTLTGAPTYCRDDAAVNFDWAAAAPAPGLPSDTFSVRWTRSQNFAAGNYMFALGSDAGARLYIDGTVVTPLVQWTPAHLYPATPPTIVVPLTAGNHTLVVEYYETTLNARVSMTWVSCSGAVGWSGDYYSNSTLTGAPTYCRDDASPNFDWGNGNPAPGILADDFSVRWTRTQNFTAGTYVFTIGSDAGARLYIDGTAVTALAQWTPAHLYPGTSPTIVVPLTAGNHTLVVEYYETTANARVSLTWVSCSGAVGWSGEYYSNSTLTGAPTYCRDDASPNFDWGNGIPAPGILADNFSVRWTRTQNFTVGWYFFSLGSDAGARLYVDGVLEVDQWTAHAYPGSPRFAFVSLAAGNHTIVVEYYELTGAAEVSLTWSGPF